MIAGAGKDITNTCHNLGVQTGRDCHLFRNLGCSQSLMLNISIIGFGDQMKDAAANLPVLGFSKVDMILKKLEKGKQVYLIFVELEQELITRFLNAG
jgi:hypothetical protein